MSPFFRTGRPRSETYSNPRSDGQHVEHRAGAEHVRPHTMRSAACRALYATPRHRAAKSKWTMPYTTQALTSHSASAEYEDDDETSQQPRYPQTTANHRIGLQTQGHARVAKYDRPSTSEDTAGVIRPVRRQQPPYHARSRSIDSDFSFSSGYSSDENLEGRPVRVCIYPQAKYIKEPELRKLADRSSSEEPATWASSSQIFKRSSLPGDEYQILVRRQKMQRARDVLEPQYAHHGSVKGAYIWHGMLQGFTVRNSERRRMSRMQYAVRKALQTDLDCLGDEFKLAANRHADKVSFCELSDVDGIPIDQTIFSEFMQLYQEARDALIEANLFGRNCNGSFQRVCINNRHHQVCQPALTISRVDSVFAMEAPVENPQLMSKFSWDSNDGEASTRKPLIKTKW